ncbi:MAG: SRPBCC domain-containing protein [Archangium sp.]|nr:SRPBCC domain-containing protein [Archangium sp.]
MSELFTHETIDISAPAATVWALLTDPALTKQYMFGCEAISDWKPGSPLIWRGELEGKPMVFVTGRVVTFEPHSLLAYTTFDPHGGMVDVPENHVTMTCRLTPLSATATRLEFSQGDFSRVQNGAARYADAMKGGDGLLEKLKQLAESDGR